MTRVARILMVVLALGFVCSCGDDAANYLEGSLTDSYPMKFEQTRARLYPEHLSIEYVNDEEGIPLRVTVDLPEEGGLQTGVKYNLMTEGDVTRGGGFDSPLPEMESGEVEFTSVGPKAGVTIAGEFNAMFIGSDQSKMVLRGGFDAELEIPEK